MGPPCLVNNIEQIFHGSQDLYKIWSVLHVKYMEKPQGPMKTWQTVFAQTSSETA